MLATTDDWDLALKAAEAAGWTGISDPRKFRDLKIIGRDPTGRYRALPAYHLSFDACERDLWPWLEERGWSHWQSQSRGDLHAVGLFRQGDGREARVVCYGWTLPIAFCHAFLKAMETNDGAE